MISAPTASVADDLVDHRLVYAHGIAALVTVLLAIAFGIIISLQFFAPDLAGPWLSSSWGRLRYAHTQGIMLGWLGNAFLAFLYHAVPVLTGRQVTSAVLGRWMFGLWNLVVVLPGWILVLSGVSQPVEWAEFPLVIDVFVIAALACAAIQFLPPFFKNGLEELYVSSWYIIGSLVFTLLAYPMGNIVPGVVTGAESAAFTGLWIHDAVGLFVTPLALSILYFVIPAVTGRPIFSHFLSMLGFWGLFFLYPLNGTHHYVFSVIPMAAQLAAIVASALLGVIVIIVVSNLLLSLRGSGLLPRETPLRFALLSVIFYLVVSVQGAMQAQMSVNQVVHFSDWVIGHSHLAMLGFATYAGIAGIIYSWQRIPFVRYNKNLVDWSFWLLSFGIVIMVIDLTIAGLVQAQLWQSEAPWFESVRQSQPYWMIRTLSAIPITAGFILLVIGLFSGERVTASDAAVTVTRHEADADSNTSVSLLKMSYRAALSAALIFFTLSVLLLGVWPGKVLDEQISKTAPTAAYGLSASEQRGREVYAREGCAYCHTQQIRYTTADIQRFGAPTLAWEGQFDSPHMWGTRRIGPDLSRAGATRSKDWQLAHLYDPRSVVPWSVMPAYPGFFNGAADKPAQEARDLVAYLETLGRARELAWPDAEQGAGESYPEDRWVQMSVNAALNNHPGRTLSNTEIPHFGIPAAASRGNELWQNFCTGCHGMDGSGNGPAARWLQPAPTNLRLYEFTEARIAQVLWEGVQGTAMPAWRDLPSADLAALVNTVAEFNEAVSGPAPTTEQLAQGKSVYLAYCAQCHGEQGYGDGFAAKDLAVAPSDFTRQRPNLGESIRVLTQGIEGSPMAPWPDRLSDGEILAVSHYLRSFFGGGQ